MILNVQPSDIIKRCLWSDYRRFCLKDKNEDEINLIIEEDKPIIISENDAYVIGLLKVVETNNLIHRFNQHMDEFLKIKSSIFNGKLYIIKNFLLYEISDFKKRFPPSFKPPFDYKRGLDELYVHIEKTLEEIKKEEEYINMIKENKVNCLLTNSVKDLFC